jgi:hypothetical protein
VSALERELASRGIDLLDHASLDHRLRRRSGDGAKRKCRTDGQRGDGFMSIDVFIVSSFPTPRLLGTVPARPLASPVPVSACDHKRVNMNHIQRRTHLTAASLW